MSTKRAIAILASQSPERLNLLKQIGLNPTVIVSNFEENLSKDLPVEDFVVKTAVGKLDVVVEDLKKSQTPFDYIIAADTVIHFENEIIGKPKDNEDARNTIRRLSGTSHDVYTGLAIYYKDGSRTSLVEKTIVTFRDLPQSTIDAYIATGGHRGKAGSYGIQRGGAVLVKKVDGCFSNIVGLPLGRVSEELEKRGFLFN
ncbi:hypothetical protein PMAYCL1PPCAC_19520 [Pristionchus mayeri]|uniref:Uncharacterized protein n=1 Tax=Pristionchus mayeri TaxID=1317129 RepID=A0AAN5CRN4_9BILA|nr:hypothetical protein PMAYCL1PPCAC_19520 [Pristionchus mayeri]